MRFQHHHHIVPNAETAQFMKEFLGLLKHVEKVIQKMSAQLDRLTKEVSENKDLAASVVALIDGLSQQIRDAVGNSDALNALADSLDEDQQAIAAAISANTPAEE